MILVDTEIREALQAGTLVISPEPPDDCIQPNSIDLHLGTHFIFYRRLTIWEKLFPQFMQVIRPKMPREMFANMVEERTLQVGDGVILHPGATLLVDTLETIKLDPDSCLCLQLGGKSSLGRIMLFIHVTAGFFDAGWDGRPTLELYYVGNRPLRLIAGEDKICQAQVWRTRIPPERAYGAKGLGSHYQGATTTALPTLDVTEVNK